MGMTLRPLHKGAGFVFAAYRAIAEAAAASGAVEAADEDLSPRFGRSSQPTLNETFMS